MCKFCVGGGESAVKIAEKLDELVCSNSQGPQELQGTAFDGHHELSLIAGCLTHHFISRKHVVDSLVGSALERHHLSHGCKSALFSQLSKPCM